MYRGFNHQQPTCFQVTALFVYKKGSVVAIHGLTYNAAGHKNPTAIVESLPSPTVDAESSER
jgi:hypothetical protein